MFAEESHFMESIVVSHQAGVPYNQRQHGPTRILIYIGKIGSALHISLLQQTEHKMSGLEAGHGFYLQHLGVCIRFLQSRFGYGHGLSQRFWRNLTTPVGLLSIGQPARFEAEIIKSSTIETMEITKGRP